MIALTCTCEKQVKDGGTWCFKDVPLICYEVMPEMEIYEGRWEQKNGRIGLKGGGIQVKGSEPLSYNALDNTVYVLNIYSVHTCRLACIHCMLHVPCQLLCKTASSIKLVLSRKDLHVHVHVQMTMNHILVCAWSHHVDFQHPDIQIVCIQCTCCVVVDVQCFLVVVKGGWGWLPFRK